MEECRVTREDSHERSKGSMHADSDGKKNKRPYIPPTITKLPAEQANRFIVERTHCSDQEAADLLESLRREQQPEK